MAYYRVCGECGCNLDPGESCDCQKTKRKEADLLAQNRPQAKTPIASLSARNLYVKELIANEQTGKNPRR